MELSYSQQTFHFFTPALLTIFPFNFWGRYPVFSNFCTAHSLPKRHTGIVTCAPTSYFLFEEQVLRRERFRGVGLTANSPMVSSAASAELCGTACCDAMRCLSYLLLRPYCETEISFTVSRDLCVAASTGSGSGMGALQ